MESRITGFSTIFPIEKHKMLKQTLSAYELNSNLVFKGNRINGDYLIIICGID